MLIRTVRRAAIAAAALCVLVPGLASGTVIDYTDCTGNTVEYTNISEDSADAPLYNQPACVGDLLDFDPLGFEANSNTENPHFIDGRVLFTVEALDGFLIDDLTISEDGDWQVFGPPSANNSQVSVTQTVRLEILISTMGGDFELEYKRRANELLDNPSFDPQSSWSISEQFVMATIFADACSGMGFFDPISGGLEGTGGVGAQLFACDATTAVVEVDIDNTLLAYSEDGNVSFINKKDLEGFTVTSETDPIPEPDTGTLLMLGLFGLGVAGRRRRAAD